MNNRIPVIRRMPARTPLRAAIAAVTLALAGPALAEERATGTADPQQSQTHADYATQSGMDGSQTQSFTSLDQDGDGQLSKDELQASDATQASMAKLDSNGDGQVSRSEFAAMQPDSMGSGQTASSQSSSSQDSSSQDSSSQTASSQSSSSHDQTASSQSSSGQGEQARAVARIGEQEQSLTTFTKALEATGMADALTDQTQYTIFAPTNEAFESRSGKSADELMKPENRQELISLLRAHIVADDVDQQMAENIGKAKTIDGGTVSLAMQNDTLQVGDAAVTGSSIQEGSLRVYPIDGVLEPQSGAQTASSGQSASSGMSSGQQTASSGGQSGAQGMQFSELDQDGNGYLDEQELQDLSSGDAAAAQLDSDQDGRVSRSEFAAFEQSSGQGQTSSQSAGDSGSSTWESPSDRQNDQQ